MLKAEIRRLTFDTAAADTRHDVLAQENKHEEQRERYHRDRCHLHGIIRFTGGAVEGVAQTVGNQLVRIVIRHQTRPDVGVPCAHHFQDGDGNQRRQGERHHDLPQVLEVARAVYLCRKIQFVRNLQEVLAQQIDVEHADKERHNQHCVGVLPAEHENRLIVGDGEQLAGNHHRRQQRAEQRVLALEFQPGKRERRQDSDNQRQNCRDDADIGGVEEQATQIAGGERIGVVADEHHARPERRHGRAVFIQRLQGRDNHPVEREQHNQRHHNEESIGDEQRQHLRDALGDADLLHVPRMHDGEIFFGHTAPLNNARASC